MLVFAICFVVYFVVSTYVVFVGLLFYMILVLAGWVFKFNFLLVVYGICKTLLLLICIY